MLCLPLQAVSGSGSPSTRPSKCFRATNPSMQSIYGGSSSAALQPTATPSSRARRPTRTTPTTVPRPPPPRQAACWEPPADRTARNATPVLPGQLKVCTVLHESSDSLETSRRSRVYSFSPWRTGRTKAAARSALSWNTASGGETVDTAVTQRKECLTQTLNVRFGSFYFTSTIFFFFSILFLS